MGQITGFRDGTSLSKLPNTRASSDFQDIKRILTVCGPSAKRAGIHELKDFANLIIYILYNFKKRHAIEIGWLLDTILQELIDEKNEWFYKDWVYLPRKGKSGLEIISAVATFTLVNPHLSVEEAAPMMATTDTMNLMALILNYYREGQPTVYSLSNEKA